MKLISDRPDVHTGCCPICQAKRYDTKFSHEKHEDGPDGWRQTTYLIVECNGCGEIYFKSIYTSSEDWTTIADHNTGMEELAYEEVHKFFPPSCPKRKPDWLLNFNLEDSRLQRLFDDVYCAWANNLNVLAAIGIRTCFDRASELVGIDTKLGFAKKLDELVSQAYLSHRDKSALKCLIDSGNAAAHRGWTPTKTEIATMLEILESFTHRTFVLNKLVVTLASSVPKQK